MGNAPTIASIPGHDEVCDCNRCILARVTIRERRTADRRAEVRTTPDRRQADQDKEQLLAWFRFQAALAARVAAA